MSTLNYVIKRKSKLNSNIINKIKKTTVKPFCNTYFDISTYLILQNLLYLKLLKKGNVSKNFLLSNLVN